MFTNLQKFQIIRGVLKTRNLHRVQKMSDGYDVVFPCMRATLRLIDQEHNIGFNLKKF